MTNRNTPSLYLEQFQLTAIAPQTSTFFITSVFAHPKKSGKLLVNLDQHSINWN